MIRRLSALLIAGALTLPAAPAHAAGGSCTAVPNPVPVGTSYTITATGLTVNTAFVVRVQQAGVPTQELFSTSDSAGNAATGGYYPGPVAQQTGTASATWKKLQTWPTGGGEIITYGPSEATCSWSIV